MAYDILLFKIPGCGSCRPEQDRFIDLADRYKLSLKVFTVKMVMPRPQGVPANHAAVHIIDEDTRLHFRALIRRPVLAYPIAFYKDLFGRAPGMAAELELILKNNPEFKSQNWAPNEDAFDWLREQLGHIELNK